MCDAFKKALVLLIYTVLNTGSTNTTYKLVEEQSPPVILGNLFEDLNLNPETRTLFKSNITISFFPMQQPGVNFFKIEHFLLKMIKRIDREKICKRFLVGSKQHEVCRCYENDENCFLKLTVLQAPYEKIMILHEVYVQIVDINDNAPVFIPDIFSLYISEAADIGSTFIIPYSHDCDNIVTEDLEYNLDPYSPLFSLLSENGSLAIKLMDLLNREVIDHYNLRVLALDKKDGLCNTGVLKLNIFVEDVNDCFPVFLDKKLKNISIPESSIIGQTIYIVRATDSDIEKNAEIRYFVFENNYEEIREYFSLNSVSGELSIKKSLDRESISRFILIVLAIDSGSPSRTSSMTINIAITDINDNFPHIKLSPVLFILENKPINSILTTFVVEDLDEGKNAMVVCKLFSKENTPPFTLKFLFYRLSMYTYKITTNFIFDREKKPLYNIVIQCHDHGTNILTSNLKVLVLIEDENDFSPKFLNAHNLSSISLMENVHFPNPIFIFQAIDPDIKENGKLVFTIKDNKFPQYFILNHSSGYLFAKEYFDYEKYQCFKLLIMVQDCGKISLGSFIQFTVHIINENDNPPEIINLGNRTIYIPENIAINSKIFQFMIIDRDNSELQSADLILMDKENHFTILGLDLINVRQFNREMIDIFQITVIAKDSERQHLFNVYEMIVIIEDINDCIPEFIFPSKDSAALDISNEATVDFTIAQISARDGDEGLNGKLTYSLHNYNSHFFLDSITGYLKVVKPLYDIQKNQIVLNISVSDLGSPPFVTFTSAHLNISRTSSKRIKNSFDILLQKSYFIITIFVLISFTFLMTIGIICLVKKYVKSNLPGLGLRSCFSDDPNKNSKKVQRKDFILSERIFQDCRSSEQYPYSHSYMITTF